MDIEIENKTITFKDGKSISVKHIAACDGIKSSCQEIVSSKFNEPKYSGYYVWRTIFPSKQTNIHFHLGSNFHVVTYPVDKKRVSLVASIKSRNKQSESWKQEGSIQNLLLEIPQSITDNYPSIGTITGFINGVYSLDPMLKLYLIKIFPT